MVYGYFDLLTRYAVETGDWDTAAKIPLLVPSRDFVAVKLQLETMAAASHKDAAVAKLAAGKLVLLAQEPGQHPFAQQIITMQAIVSRSLFHGRPIATARNKKPSQALSLTLFIPSNLSHCTEVEQ
jgi:hypothetical protein